MFVGCIRTYPEIEINKITEVIAQLYEEGMSKEREAA